MPTTLDQLRAKYRRQTGIWLAHSAPSRDELGSTTVLGCYEGPFESVLSAVVAEYGRVFIDDTWCGLIEPVTPKRVGPPLKIQVCDWSRGKLLEGTRFREDQLIDGTLEEALHIAGEVYTRGHDVMLRHVATTDDAPAIRLWVDDGAFRQR